MKLNYWNLIIDDINFVFFLNYILNFLLLRQEVFTLLVASTFAVDTMSPM